MYICIYIYIYVCICMHVNVGDVLVGSIALVLLC